MFFISFTNWFVFWTSYDEILSFYETNKVNNIKLLVILFLILYKYSLLYYNVYFSTGFKIDKLAKFLFKL